MAVKMRIILLFVVMVLSEEVKMNLTSTFGGSITLSDPVDDGFLLFGGKVITTVNNSKIKPVGKIYEDKVLWNNNTGLFTITRLQKNDSGIYSIQNNEAGASDSSYKITVYDPVSTPAVKTLNVSAESCILQCFVEKAEETTLLWYKDEKILDQSSSSFSLPLTVLKEDFSSSFRCVAANPADQKTLLVNVTISCTEKKDVPGRRKDGDRDRYIIAVVISILLTLIIILVVLYKWKRSDKSKTTTTHQQVSSEAEVQYSEVTVSADRRQKSEPSLESSEPVDKSNLTTVYDKLEAHRLSPNLTDTADHVCNQILNTVYMNT